MIPKSDSITKNIVITAVGPDRCGIVSETCKIVDTFGGSVGESRAQKLGKHFSIMMLVNTPADSIAKLTETLNVENSVSGVNINVYETDVSMDETEKIAYGGYIKLEGADHPGKECNVYCFVFVMYFSHCFVCFVLLERKGFYILVFERGGFVLL